MNPHRIRIHIKSHNIRVKREFELFNVEAHLQGEYFCEALAAVVGKMFGGKHEYPKEAYKFGNETSEELTEQEIQAQRDLFVARFLAMQSNFNLAKGKKNETEQTV